MTVEKEMLEISRAELHGPINLGGKNHSGKLRHSDGVAMRYCRVHKEMLVHYNGEDGVIPATNIALLVPVKHKPKAKAAEPAGPNIAIKAQVETPQDHVFAGPGHGKTK